MTWFQCLLRKYPGLRPAYTPHHASRDRLRLAAAALPMLLLRKIIRLRLALSCMVNVYGVNVRTVYLSMYMLRSRDSFNILTHSLPLVKHFFKVFLPFFKKIISYIYIKIDAAQKHTTDKAAAIPKALTYFLLLFPAS